MNGRFSLASGAIAAVAAALLSACASTGDTARTAHAGYASMIAPRGMLQLASLHGFQSSDPPAAPVAASDQDDTRICRSAAPATGSRLGPQTMCMTGGEWIAKSQNDRDELTNAETRALAGTPNPEF